MKHNYIHLVLGVIILVLTFDIGIGYILNKRLNEVSGGFIGEINRSILSQDDILVIGSSRAKHHYNSKIIENITGKECYNAGLNGYGVTYSYALLSEKFNIYKPDIILLDISPNVLVDKSIEEKLTRFTPFAKRENAFEEIIRNSHRHPKLLLNTFNAIKYNSTLYDFLQHHFIKTNDSLKGFIPLIAEDQPNSIRVSHLESVPSISKRMHFLNKIVRLCETNNCQLIVVISPTYQKFDSKNEIISKVQKLCSEAKVPLIDYSNWKLIYNKPEYFIDQLHLNSSGANIFSEAISMKILDIQSIK